MSDQPDTLDLFISELLRHGRITEYEAKAIADLADALVQAEREGPRGLFCSCGNRFADDNLCMPSACEREE